MNIKIYSSDILTVKFRFPMLSFWHHPLPRSVLAESLLVNGLLGRKLNLPYHYLYVVAVHGAQKLYWLNTIELPASICTNICAAALLNKPLRILLIMSLFFCDLIAKRVASNIMQNDKLCIRRKRMVKYSKFLSTHFYVKRELLGSALHFVSQKEKTV